jgi:hypothetical protein
LISSSSPGSSAFFSPRSVVAEAVKIILVWQSPFSKGANICYHLYDKK